MTLRELMPRSSASAAFLDALATFARTGMSNERVTFDAYSPPVKVERALTKMLEAYPDVEIERVHVQGASGCEFFSGKMLIQAADGERKIRFHWDCKWRAMQQGWTDYFGFPDQTRAAREFGYDCFREWTELEVPEAAELSPLAV